MDDSKQQQRGPPARRAQWPKLLAGIALVGFIHFLLQKSPGSPERSEVCPQPSIAVPERNNALWSELTALHATDAFLQRAVARLSAAVQIPTETYDDMGPVGDDPRWVTRAPFVQHLKTAFPLLQHLVTYGLIYTWQGSDAGLKPLLLMGHYDVVPVAPLSADSWTHPAYSGHFDGKSIWGRGSVDDKAGVVGILTTIETLLERGFTPARTVVLSFGFDEEAGGFHGAGHLGPALLHRFGEDSFTMILDEGSGFLSQYGTLFASPAIAEKGYADISLRVSSPGGHSSVPPTHTSIGILAALITHLEAHPPPAHLALDTPVFGMAECLARYAPGLPGGLRRAVLGARRSEGARREAERGLFGEGREWGALAGTTQAVDLVRGGVKSNALPEWAVALVNHRIATDSTVNATLERTTTLLRPLASDFNLSVTAYGHPLPPFPLSPFTHPSTPFTPSTSAGHLEISAPRTLAPAPVTPTEGAEAGPWRVLAGSIRGAIRVTYGDGKGGEEVYVAPGIMSGNTDTRFNWALSRHIFRYGHGNMVNGLGGIHTVDEHIGAVDFVGMITFFTTLVLNVDEAEL